MSMSSQGKKTFTYQGGANSANVERAHFISVIERLLHLIPDIPDDIIADLAALGFRQSDRPKKRKRRSEDGRDDLDNDLGTTPDSGDKNTEGQGLLALLPSTNAKHVKYTCCKQCPEVMQSEEELVAHRLRVHPGDRRWSCARCNTMYLTTREKMFHFRACHKRETARVNTAHVCHVCGKVAASSGGLRKHLTIHKNTENRLEQAQEDSGDAPAKDAPADSDVICDVCGDLVKKHRMSYHMNKHTRPVSCDVCDMRFANRKTLDHHKLRAHGDMTKAKFQCQSCSMSFTSRQMHDMHQDVHKDVYDVACPTCGKKFISKRYLQTHIRAMHSERPHQCPQCDKAYAFKTELRNHMTYIHGNQKRPGYCSKCKLKFESHSAANAHQKEVHGNEAAAYDCCFCNRKFGQRYRYRKHLRDAHGTETSVREDGVVLVHQVIQEHVTTEPEVTPETNAKADTHYNDVIIDNQGLALEDPTIGILIKVEKEDTD